MGYFTPESLEDALALVAEGEAKIICGGTDFFPSLKQGQTPERIIDVSRIRELRDVRESRHGWRIGAGVKWATLSYCSLPRYFDCLKEAALTIGAVQIQNAATIGGNICNASPAADGVPPLLALEARIEVRSLGSTRMIPIGEFISGVRQTQIRPGELMTGILVPKMSEFSGSAFVKLGSRKYLVISIAMVAAIIRSIKDKVVEARVAVGACSEMAMRLPQLESDLCGIDLAELHHFSVADQHMKPLEPIDDIRGSAKYRIEAAREIAQRAILRAVHGV